MTYYPLVHFFGCRPELAKLNARYAGEAALCIPVNSVVNVRICFWTGSKIRLFFREQAIPDYRDLGILAIRLMCRVSFRTPDGFTDPYPTILDTGAPISLIPLQIWKGWGIEAEVIRDSTIRGVVPRNECQLLVTLAEVQCKLVGVQDESEVLPVKAHLAPSDAVPLILGFKDLLDRVSLHVDYQKGEASAEVGSR